MNNDILGVGAAIVAMVAMGLLNGFSKRPSETLGPVHSTIYRQAITVPLLLLSVLFTIDKTDFDLSYIAIGIAISCASYLGLYYFMKGVGTGKASIVSPVASTRVLVTAATSFLLFGEKLNGIQLFAMLLILLGVISLSIDFKAFRFKDIFSSGSGLGFALLAALFWGITFALFPIPIAVIGAYLFSFILEVSVLLTASAQLMLQGESFRRPMVDVQKVKNSLIGMGLAGAILTLFLNLGYDLTNVGVVTAITSANPLITIVYGKLFLNESLNAKQYISIAILLLGIVMISYF